MEKRNSFRSLHNTWSFSAGVSLWLAAIAIPLGGNFLQAAEFIGIIGIILIFLSRKGPPNEFIIIALLIFISWSFSATLSDDLKYYVYYCIFIFPFLFSLSVYFQNDVNMAYFIKGFLFGGLLSVALFYAQYFFGAELLDFRNNENFSLPPQFGRGFALLPEVSTLASMIILLLPIMIIRAISTKNIFHILQTILVFGALFLTASTTILIIFPFMMFITFVTYTKLSVRGFIVFLIAILFVTVFVSIFLDSVYAQRSGAISSASARFATIYGALTSIFKDNFFGVGLGKNDLVFPYARQAAFDLGLRFMELPEGITSLTAARIFEEGIFGLVQVTFSIALLIVVAIKRHRLSDQGKALFVLAVACFVVSTGVSGYRGLLSSWIWIPICPALIANLRQQKLRGSP